MRKVITCHIWKGGKLFIPAFLYAASNYLPRMEMRKVINNIKFKKGIVEWNNIEQKQISYYYPFKT